VNVTVFSLVAQTTLKKEAAYSSELSVVVTDQRGVIQQQTVIFIKDVVEISKPKIYRVRCGRYLITVGGKLWV